MKSIELTLKNSVRKIRRHIPNTHLAIACVLSGILVTALVLTPSEEASAERNISPIALSLPDPAQQQIAFMSPVPLEGKQPYNSMTDNASIETLIQHTIQTEKAPLAEQQSPSKQVSSASHKLSVEQQSTTDQTANNQEYLFGNITQTYTQSFLAKELKQIMKMSLPQGAVSSNPPKPLDPLKSAWKSYKVKKGDNLSLIFQQVGLSGKDIAKVMSGNPKAKQLTRIYPGQMFDFKIVKGELQTIRFDKNRLHQIEFHKTDSGFQEKEKITKPEIKLTYRNATITNSLFLDGVKAGINENIIMQLAGIFAWDIDFALDIRKNDELHILYEEKYINDEKIGTGNILAAHFINRDKPFKAVRFTDSQGHTKYYTPEGRGMRKAFLRSPVDFARISSHFNLKRKHPVLNKIRAHKGTDYAAATGTPIRSAGDGKVSFIGTKGGYGRTIIIQHSRTYKSLYAHMSKYNSTIKNGARVKQGQVIGYVGSSGLATGPHLHYEFYVNNAVRNPVTVDLPTSLPVPEAERTLFNTQTQPLILSLNEHLNGNNQHAMSEESDKNANTN